MLCEAPSSHI
jgi:hypothetical protein